VADLPADRAALAMRLSAQTIADQPRDAGHIDPFCGIFR
jgi:hypothetical protein